MPSTQCPAVSTTRGATSVAEHAYVAPPDDRMLRSASSGYDVVSAPPMIGSNVTDAPSGSRPSVEPAPAQPTTAHDRAHTAHAIEVLASMMGSARGSTCPSPVNGGWAPSLKARRPRWRRAAPRDRRTIDSYISQALRTNGTRDRHRRRKA